MANRENETEQRQSLEAHASRASALLAEQARVRKSGGRRPSAFGKAPAPKKRSVSGESPDSGKASASGGSPTSGKPSALGKPPVSGNAPAPGNAPAEQAYPKNLREFIRRNIVYIAACAAVVALVTVAIFVVHAFQSPAEADVAEEESANAAYTSPYDWTKLDRSNGRFQYIVDDQVKSRLGIDVSESQHVIDWASVASDGIDFAMIRLGYRGSTEGGLYLDEQYWTNLDGARDAGLDCGVYFFSQAVNVEEAEEEADYVLERLNGAPLECPIGFDSEALAVGLESSRTEDLTNDEMAAIAEAFCNRVGEAGYRSIVYGNAFDLSRYSRTTLEQTPIWWAEYDTPVPSASIDFELWQYSHTGTVAGIETSVDMNIDLSACQRDGGFDTPIDFG